MMTTIVVDKFLNNERDGTSILDIDGVFHIMTNLQKELTRMGIPCTAEILSEYNEWGNVEVNGHQIQYVRGAIRDSVRATTGYMR